MSLLCSIGLHKREYINWYYKTDNCMHMYYNNIWIKKVALGNKHIHDFHNLRRCIRCNKHEYQIINPNIFADSYWVQYNPKYHEINK